MLQAHICQKARLSRDIRFDGIFFIAVKTTRIYCRPICPANAPLEKNTLYFAHAIEAANAGYRPCLRCRPDSAPGSPAWQGVHTTLSRAIHLIKQGILQEGKLADLTLRLGISDRYLRLLFQKHLGTSPKAYALYQQCLFAKQLLHQTNLPITQIALASGFNSIRRFNDYFRTQLQLTPSEIRNLTKKGAPKLQLHLSYRPPYDWHAMQQFLAARFISQLEWCDENNYGRSFDWHGSTGTFNAEHIEHEHKFIVIVDVTELGRLQAIVNNIRRILDLDADMQTIEQNLQQNFPKFIIKSGLRLPGTWTLFEAGIRAILGQQISITAARNLVSQLVDELGESIADKKLFPTPCAITSSDLSFLKIPTSRKQTLQNLARHYLTSKLDKNNYEQKYDDPDQWLHLKGIGPWTINYAKMRGQSHPDIYLAGDLGVKNAVKELSQPINFDLASPWGSYFTLQLWSQLK